MTRTARPGLHQQKRIAHDATPWQEMTKGVVKKPPLNPKQMKARTSSEDPVEIARQLAEKKDKRREHRRIKRARKREMSKVCFHCRMPGHGMADCPTYKDNMEQASNICYKCGSSKHLARVCTAKVPQGQLSFAKCFICGEKGHLSGECPDNPRALYVDGGSCPLCGSVEHLKRDCPERDVKDEVKVYKRVEGVHVSVDEELALYEDIDEKKERQKMEEKNKKKKNVVFF